MINPGKSFASLTHPSAVFVLLFSKLFAEHFPSVLAALSGVPLPHWQWLCLEKDPSPTPHPTPCPGTQGRCREQSAPAPQSDAASGNIQRETRDAPPALVGSSEMENLLQPPATSFYWELIGNLELRNLSMSIDAYTEKRKFTCFSSRRNPCPNICNFIQRHNCLALPWLLTVLHPVKMGRSLRPSEGRHSTSKIITSKLLKQEAATGALPSRDTTPGGQLHAILSM